MAAPSIDRSQPDALDTLTSSYPRRSDAGGEASECYAEEARTFLDQLLYGRHVELIPDPPQTDVDKYGRLLRNVLVDGLSAAQLALTAGTGYEYTYDTAYRDQQTHRDDERAAAEDVLGQA